jgi:hypothetical protein
MPSRSVCTLADGRHRFSILQRVSRRTLSLTRQHRDNARHLLAEARLVTHAGERDGIPNGVARLLPIVSLESFNARHSGATRGLIESPRWLPASTLNEREVTPPRGASS